MSDKEVKIRITGDVSDLEKKLKSIEKSLNDLGKSNSGNNKFVNSLIDDIGQAERKIESLGDSFDDAANSFKKFGKNSSLDEVASDLSNIDKKTDEVANTFKDIGKGITSIDSKKLEGLSQTMAEIATTRDDIEKAAKSLNSINGNIDLSGSTNKVKNNTNSMVDDIASGFISGSIAGKMMSQSISGVVDDLLGISQALDKVGSNRAELENTTEYFTKLSNEIEQAENKMKELKILLSNSRKDLELSKELNDDGLFDDDINKARANMAKYKKEIMELEEILKELYKREDKPLTEFEDQEDAYEKLKNKVLDFIRDSEKSALVQEKVAKAFQETSQAMKNMSKGYDDTFDGIHATEFLEVLERARKEYESLKLVNTKNLEQGFESLGKSIADKTEKLTKFKEILNNVDGDTRKYGNSLERQADIIREYAESANYAVEQFQNEDGKNMIRVIAKTEEAVESAKKKQDEYNRVIAEYLSLTKEAGGDISKKFLDDKGDFDAKKFIQQYEQWGEVTTQLTTKFNALRQQTLQYLKDEEESIENKRKFVKVCNEQAEALKDFGVAAKGIDLDEIRDIDKTLATNLKDLFPDNLPDSFKGWIEHIKAAFSELGDLEFGNFGDFLKDIGKGVLKALPTEAKIAAVAITALTVALKKCADLGIAKFNKGVDTIKNTFSKIKSLAISFGNEVRTAFESITGTHIDLSSLMELGPNFEHQMQRVGAIAGSNKQQLAQLSDEAKRLGGTTQFTATQVGQAFEYMAMAGWDTNEMLASMEDVLNLAIASGTDLAKTSDIVTDYMTAMGMSANQTGDFVDKLAATVTSSNTNVEQFGMAMKQVASQAGSLGITMTDLSTAIGLQANAGVKGSKAGTALKNILTNMASPTEKQAKALKELGFAADKTGSYFKLTADGAVDLEATVKQLMSSTENMTRAQKAATLAQFAGREALPGLMALLSQGASGWDELSATIENSTSKIQYWNENMSLAGKKGDEATKLIKTMKDVFAETEMEASALGLSTGDLSHAIALLGDDGKVSTKNVQDLLDVIESMNTATGEAEERWRALDGGFKNAVNTGYDYDATIAKLTADTTGLSQATKDQIEEQLKGVDTYKEANAILSKYGLTAEKVSFESLSFAQKLDYLRDNLKNCSEEYVKTQLANLGLADSYDEVMEVLKMSDEEFDAYATNLETVRTMTERLKDAMDSTTKAGLLTLASAIENVCIAAFEKIKPVLNNTTKAINEFFDTWHNGDKNIFTFDGLEKGLAGLESKLSKSSGSIKNAVVNLFSDLDRFINGGSLQSLLNMGTKIISSIADGINQAKNNGTLDAAISGAINSIATWCSENLDTVIEAGRQIIESIRVGIYDNQHLIGEVIQEVINMQMEIDNAIAEEKGFLFGSNLGTWIGKGIESWVSEKASWFTGFYDSLFTYKDNEGNKMMYSYDPSTGTGQWLNLGKEAGSAYAQGNAQGIKENKENVSNSINDNFKEAKVKTGITSSEIGQEVSDNIMAKLETMDASQLAALGTELTNLQTTVEGVATGIGTSFETIRNASRESFVGMTNILRNQFVNCTNIVRNQAVNMANIVRNQCLNMSNIFRNQFVNMANIARNQMVNVSNIVRNQAVSWSNVIRNQVTNARNALTSQFLSMAAVARTQMVNISNIVRNQAVSWANVVRNQSANMKAAFSTAFSGLAGVAARGMAACLSTVRSYMAQIKAATAQTMTMNFKVNKTMTTTNVTKNVTQGLANTMGNIARSSASLIAPQSIAIGGSIGTNRTVGGLGSVESLELSVPLTVDGREIARATARYNQDEIAKLSKRNNRRRGEN